jgi:hypothetical protein
MALPSRRSLRRPVDGDRCRKPATAAPPRACEERRKEGRKALIRMDWRRPN